LGTYSVLRVFHQSELNPHLSYQSINSSLIKNLHLQSACNSPSLNPLLGSFLSIRCIHDERRSSKGQSELKSTTDSEIKKTSDSSSDDVAKEFLEKEAEKPKKLTLVQRFKKTYKEHGKVLIGVHVATSVMWYASFYLAARQGINVIPLLEWLNVGESYINPLRGNAGYIATTVVLVKLATPLRYSATIGGTLGVIKYLRKEGKMEPVAAEDRLSSMYKEGSENIKKNIKHRSRLSQVRMRRKYDKKVIDMKNKVSVMKNRLKQKDKKKK